MTETWQEALDRWEQWQKARGHDTEHTIPTRLRRIRHFAAALGNGATSSNRDPLTASAEDLVDYLAGLGVARCTLATYHAHLRCWFKWLVLTDRRVDDPSTKVPAPKIPRRRPRPLTDEQLLKLLATRVRKRTRMMTYLALFQGLRAHEIAKFRGEDCDLESMQLYVLGKGDVDAVLPLHPVVAQFAREFPAVFPRRGWWFPAFREDSPKAHVLARSVSNIFSEVFERAGIEGSVHRLRHTYATRLVKNGTNIRVVQELLRHANLDTTAIYAGVDWDQQREAVIGLSLPA